LIVKGRDNVPGRTKAGPPRKYGAERVSTLTKFLIIMYISANGIVVYYCMILQLPSHPTLTVESNTELRPILSNYEVVRFRRLRVSK